MKKVTINTSVEKATNYLKQSLEEKGFILFCDVDHQKNAEKVDLELVPARTLIFGNPLSGTKLMQADVSVSLDLPMRIAIAQVNGNTSVLYQTSDDLSAKYQLANHPVLEKIDGLFAKLVAEVAEL